MTASRLNSTRPLSALPRKAELVMTAPDRTEQGALADELWEAAAGLEDEGSLVAAAELYRQAVAAYENADEESTARRLDLHLAGLLTTIGDADGAREVLGRVLDWSHRAGDRLVEASVRVWEAELEVDQALDADGPELRIDAARLDRAADQVGQAATVFEEHEGEAVPMQVRSLVLAGEIATLAGRPVDAAEHLQRALQVGLSDTAWREDEQDLQEQIVLDLVESLVAADRPDEGGQVLKDARRRALRDKDEEGVWLWTLHLGQHLAVTGDVPGARQWLTRLRDQLEIAGDQDYLPEVREALAGLTPA